MLRLALVRHAKSSWNAPELSDFERPLNARGKRDAPIMVQRYALLGRQPDHLVSSPALRAITTARLFCAGLDVSPDDIEVRPRIYEASLDGLLETLRSLDSGARHVMMFGHNPGFTELARTLAHCPFNDMPTCSIAAFELHAERWAEVGPGCGRLIHFLYPKDGAS
ncbi:SixA phosphatase family protein [Panacagrimonas sp.]|uniref:SixA phosphatase family protein n=1 Tax=Panacagrimonas sp. TaxID=2480088 RepID=UPI003B527F56